jgi:hypothetical protein
VQDTVRKAVGGEQFGEQDPSHMNYRNGPGYANGGKADNFDSATSNARGLAANQGFSNDDTLSQQMPPRNQDAYPSRTEAPSAYNNSARNTDYSRQMSQKMSQQMPSRTQDTSDRNMDYTQQTPNNQHAIPSRSEDANAYSDPAPSQTSRLNHKRSMSIPRKSVGDFNASSSSTKQNLPGRERNDWSMTGSGVLGAASRNSSSVAGYTPSVSGDIRQGRQQIYKNAFTVEGAAQAPSLHGIVDLTNTVDTTTDIVYAPGKSSRPYIISTVLTHSSYNPGSCPHYRPPCSRGTIHQRDPPPPHSRAHSARHRRSSPACKASRQERGRTKRHVL